jgi:hypothetical protein
MTDTYHYKSINDERIWQDACLDVESGMYAQGSYKGTPFGGKTPHLLPDKELL